MTTAGDGESEEEAPQSVQKAQLPSQLMDIFRALAEDKNIVFKSQQIDDPELDSLEKEALAREAFEKNRETFLIRFGAHLTLEQLTAFENLGIGEPLKPEENLAEMSLLLDDYRRKLMRRSVCVKNRRFLALQQLLAKGEYFSEHEMMLRAPELYQEFVGQYLSEAEKQARDSYDVRNTSFSGILMHSLEKQQREELLEKAKGEMEEEESEDSAAAAAAPDFEVPAACRQRWGGFDDEPVACSTSRAPATVKISTPEVYNPGERELLRKEFLSLMTRRFLSGEDKDFDYTAVDDNAMLDDLKQIEQDEEDAYFDSDSNGDLDDGEVVEQAKETKEASSEDELDIYMRHLSKHHSLQQ
ncbi:hypothetical protein KR018_008659 [Drosophila ironensis]|nr:hypothetical protein KR018_008659 [Drosophila ironensis]